MKLRTDQRKAIKGAVAELNVAARATIVMPPGAGKTFVSYEIDQQLGNDLTIFFCPNVGLVYQTVLAWQRYGLSAHVFAFTAGKMSAQDKELLSTLSNKQVITTTDGRSLKEHLAVTGGKKVAFATYQAAKNLVAARLAADLLIFDEAHHLVGKKDKGWRVLLLQKNIKGKRLFLTATPKLLRYKNAAVVDMADTKLFGKIVYSMSVAEATKKKILVPVQIVLASIDKTKQGQLPDKHILVAATRKAVITFKLKKGLSFHSRVLDAQRFAKDANQYDKTLNAFSLSAANDVDERKAVLNKVDAGKGIIANARLFNEGFDYTALDYVVLTEPKYSLIDITQIVGRVMRRHRGKKLSTIVLPISSQDVEKERRFDKTLEIIWQILSLRNVDYYGIASLNIRPAATDFFKDVRLKVIGGPRLRKHLLTRVERYIQLRQKSLVYVPIAQRIPLLRKFCEKHGRLPTTTEDGALYTFWYSMKQSRHKYFTSDQRKEFLEIINKYPTPGDLHYHRDFQLNGATYKTVRDASIALGYSGNAIAKWLRTGVQPLPHTIPFEWNGAKYPSLVAAAKAFNLSAWRFKKWRNNGCIGAPPTKRYVRQAAARKPGPTNASKVRGLISKHRRKGRIAVVDLVVRKLGMPRSQAHNYVRNNWTA